jgi:hypothetical protein
MDNQDGTGQYIWLRYATQYSKDGRTHTIEMGIPVPLGASAEAREKLLHEAETGMSQLVQHVEERVFQALERVQSGHTTGNQGIAATVSQTVPPSAVKKAEPTVSSPLTLSTAQQTQSVSDQSPPLQTRPANRSASVPAPLTTGQAPNVQRAPSRTAPPSAQTVDVPPTRHSVGAGMPSSLGPTSTGGSLTIPDFISYINENMRLSPKQAMELLRVKSLAGINLREALETLKRIMAQNAQGGTNVPQQPQHQGQLGSMVREAHPVVSAPVSRNTPVAPLPVKTSQSTASLSQDVSLSISELPAKPASEALEHTEPEHVSNVIEMRVPQPAKPAHGFDEEIDGNEELEDLDEFDNLSLSSEISPERLGRARDKISALRGMQGATVASAARLQVLRNAADDEVTTEQLQQLVAGVWNIQALKKLKVDQVEALISWAKEDYFLDEVEAVLIVLEEERYARGNR